MENWKKTFGIIWSGQLASILSSSVVGYAIIFWMSIETGSAEVLALAAIAGMLPQSLLGPVVGVYVDRWDRKRTMILADSFIAFCTLILAVLFWFIRLCFNISSPHKTANIKTKIIIKKFQKFFIILSEFHFSLREIFKPVNIHIKIFDCTSKRQNIRCKSRIKL